MVYIMAWCAFDKDPENELFFTMVPKDPPFAAAWNEAVCESPVNLGGTFPPLDTCRFLWESVFIDCEVVGPFRLSSL